MKKVLLVLIVLTITSCTKKKKNYALFSGKIENPNSNILSIINSYNKKILEIKVSDTGTFNDTIFNANGYFKFSYGKENSEIYLQDGYDITLTMNSKKFNESLVYNGIGSRENDFSAKKNLINQKYSDIDLYSSKENVFLKKLNNQRTELLNSLNKDLDKDFIKLEKKNIKYEYILALKKYELGHALFTNNEKFKVSENFPHPTEALDYDNEEDYKLHQAYRPLVKMDFLKTRIEKSIKNNISIQEASIIYIKKIKSNIIKNVLIFDELSRDISNDNPEVDDLYNAIIELSTDEDFKTKITKRYNLIKRLVRGKDSPTFYNFENYSGGTLSLKKLKGKYVYIDVWATWCGPCKAEIPSLKKIQKQYHNKNIKFVSISIDVKKNHDSWEQMIKDKELGGIQLFADKDWNSKFIKDYGINSIPRFILINPEGKIISANAPRPSNKKLTNLFDELKI